MTLDPGEERQLRFDLGFEELAYWDNRGRQKITPGAYTVWIGGDSRASQSASFQVAP